MKRQRCSRSLAARLALQAVRRGSCRPRSGKRRSAQLHAGTVRPGRTPSWLLPCAQPCLHFRRARASGHGAVPVEYVDDVGALAAPVREGEPRDARVFAVIPRRDPRGPVPFPLQRKRTVHHARAHARRAARCSACLPTPGSRSCPPDARSQTRVEGLALAGPARCRVVFPNLVPGPGPWMLRAKKSRRALRGCLFPLVHWNSKLQMLLLLLLYSRHRS